MPKPEIYRTRITPLPLLISRPVAIQIIIAILALVPSPTLLLLLALLVSVADPALHSCV
jgi:hypothetical protein